MDNATRSHLQEAVDGFTSLFAEVLKAVENITPELQAKIDGFASRLSVILNTIAGQYNVVSDTTNALGGNADPAAVVAGLPSLDLAGLQTAVRKMVLSLTFEERLQGIIDGIKIAMMFGAA